MSFVMMILLTAGLFLSNAGSQTDSMLGGEIRGRLQAAINPDFDKTHPDDRGYTQHRIRLHVSASPLPSTGMFIQIQDTRLWGSEGGTLSPHPSLHLHQAFITWMGFDSLLTLNLGRMEKEIGNGWLVGDYDFHEVGRAFDGLYMQMETSKARLALMGFPIRESTAINFSRSQYFAGVLGGYQLFPGLLIESYGLWLNDQRNINPFIERANPVKFTVSREDPMNLYTTSIRMLWSDPSGFSADMEAGYQFGEMGLLAASSWAAHGSLHYAANLFLQPEFETGFAYARGDDNRGDAFHKTWTNLFPDVHDQLGNMDAVGWSNIRALWMGTRIQILDFLFTGATLYRFTLDKTTDHWYRGGGFQFFSAEEIYRQADELADPLLGHELDLEMFILPDPLGLRLELGMFFPGPFFARQINRNRFDWLALSVTGVF